MSTRKALTDQFEIAGCYDLHRGTNSLGFDEDESREYMAGRQTLRELILARLE